MEFDEMISYVSRGTGLQSLDFKLVIRTTDLCFHFLQAGTQLSLIDITVILR